MRPLFKAPSRAITRMRRLTGAALLCVSAPLMLACGHSHPESGKLAAGGGDDKVVNFYTWSDYIAPDTITSFEKLTGIKVNVSYFDTNEMLEAHMLTGHSGFDVVITAGPYFQRQIRSGAYLPLDKKQLPNIVNLDSALMTQAALNDPGNAYGVIYTWGTYGIGYNEQKLAEALPNTPIKSWGLIFDPAFAARLASCGINIVDTPAAVTRAALEYLGRNPNEPTAQDLVDVDATLTKIRPYIRNIESENYIQALANGDICIALGVNGDIVQAGKRAEEAKNRIKVRYLVPEEGTLIWFDMLAIPKDATHVANAYRFIDYLMNPSVIANISNFIGYANGNSSATPLLNRSTAEDPAIYPTPIERQKWQVHLMDSPERSRAITRIWQRFKTAQ
jgi:putrescine transport system substrate-binding protein